MAVEQTTTRQSPGLAKLGLALTEHAPWPMALVEGKRHLVRYVNPAFCQWLHKPAQQLVGKPFARMMPGNKEFLSLLNRVHRTGQSERHTERQSSRADQLLWSCTLWPVLASRRPVGVVLQVIETAKFHEQTVAMNEALMLASLRQHQLTEASENLNAQLQAEMEERERVEGRRRMEVLTASNRKLKQEIIRRQAVEKTLQKSKSHQTRLLEQSRRMQDQLRNLSQQVLRAQEEERKRISRELHDVIAQTLTGINILLANLKRGAALNTRDFDRSISRTQKLVEKSVDLVHRFARELRPAVLDDLGLIPALHSFMHQFAARTGVHTRLTAFAEVERLDIGRRTVLFRVAQEALTNVARHAKASRVDVNLKKLPRLVCLEIKDDGKSFDVERVRRGNRGRRLGLLGMSERLEMVGGRLTVTSAPDQGTTILAQIPFANGRGRRTGQWASSTEH